MKNGLYENVDNKQMLLAGLFLAGGFLFGSWLTGQWFALQTGYGPQAGIPFYVIGNVKFYDITAFFRWFNTLVVGGAHARVLDGLWVVFGLSGGAFVAWSFLRQPTASHDSRTPRIKHRTPTVIVGENYAVPAPTQPESRDQLTTVVDPIDGTQTSPLDILDQFSMYTNMIGSGLGKPTGRDGYDWAPIHSAVTARVDEDISIDRDRLEVRSFELSPTDPTRTQEILDLVEGFEPDVFEPIIDSLDEHSRVTRHGFEIDATKTPRVVPMLADPIHGEVTRVPFDAAKTTPVDQDFNATALISETDLSEVLEEVNRTPRFDFDPNRTTEASEADMAEVFNQLSTSHDGMFADFTEES